MTVPKAVLVALGIGPGDRVYFVQMADCNFAVMPATKSIKRLKGIIPKPKKPVSPDAMDDTVAEGATGE